MNYDYVLPVLALLIVGVSVGNVLMAQDAASSLSQKVEEVKNSVPKLPSIQVITLSVQNCADCFDVSSAVSKAKNKKANVTEERVVAFDSVEGKALVAKYAVEKVPTVIVTGEVENASFLSSFGKKSGGAVVFDALTPVYFDVASSKFVGRVSVTLIGDSSCEKCVNYAELPAQLEQNGVKIGGQQKLEFKDEAALALIAKYNISKVPSIVLSSDISAYPQIVEALGAAMAVASDGSYVLNNNNAPFREVESGSVRGFVNVTYLSDDSCADCYNASIHRPILERYGLALDLEQNVSITSKEGKALVAKYNVTKVPTILLSKDASVYTGFASVWAQVGSVEEDGTFVFRNIDTALKGYIYKDLETGQVIGRATPTPLDANAAAIVSNSTVAAAGNST